MFVPIIQMHHNVNNEMLNDGSMCNIILLSVGVVMAAQKWSKFNMKELCNCSALDADSTTYTQLLFSL